MTEPRNCAKLIRGCGNAEKAKRNDKVFKGEWFKISTAFSKTMIKYPALLFEDGAYIGVEFPDLPGCFTQADNLTQAIQAAKKALHCYLADVDEKDYPTPKTYPDAVEIEMTSADDDSPKTPPEAPCFSYGEEGGGLG